MYPVPGQVLLCVEIHLWAAFSEARRTDEPASEPWACMHVVPIIASSTHSPLGTFWGQRRGPRNRPSPAGPLPFPFSRGRVSRVKQAGPRGFQKPDRGGTRCARASDGEGGPEQRPEITSRYQIQGQACRPPRRAAPLPSLFPEAPRVWTQAGGPCEERESGESFLSLHVLCFLNV